MTDSDFRVDKNSDAYKLVKPQSTKARQDDIDSVDDPEEQGSHLHKLFAGEADENTDLASKLSKKQQKKLKRQDKILTGGGAIRTLNTAGQKNAQSKKIKKNTITEAEVRQKLRTRRLVVASGKLK